MNAKIQTWKKDVVVIVRGVLRSMIGKSTTCSQCGKLCQVVRCYINKNDGKIWCEHCLALEKKRRNLNNFGTIIKRWHQKDF